MDTKPPMSRTEASWHTHLAGMRAAEEARKQGANPAAVAALVSATAGPVEIGGFRLYPPTEGTVWTLKRIAREFKAWADALGMPRAAEGESDGTRELLELGLSTLVFCDALGCWQDLECGRLESLIARADALVWSTDLEIMRQLGNHFEAGMRQISDLTADAEAPKKKPGEEQTPNGNSPGTPIPQAGPDSPPSNG